MRCFFVQPPPQLRHSLPRNYSHPPSNPHPPKHLPPTTLPSQILVTGGPPKKGQILVTGGVYDASSTISILSRFSLSSSHKIILIGPIDSSSKKATEPYDVLCRPACLFVATRVYRGFSLYFYNRTEWSPGYLRIHSSRNRNLTR